MLSWKHLNSGSDVGAIRQRYFEPIVQMQKEYDEWSNRKPRNQDETKLKSEWLKNLLDLMDEKAQTIERIL